MTAYERVINHIRRLEDGCWIYQRSTDGNGYGFVWDRTRMRRTHIVTYEHVNGPVPPGLMLDHLCRVPGCVRPSHLRAVTPKENALAPGALSFSAVNSKKTHCLRGHAYDTINTHIDSEGRRRCRQCVREQSRRRYIKKVGRPLKFMRWGVAIPPER